jgi:hypothetical protein
MSGQVLLLWHLQGVEPGWCLWGQVEGRGLPQHLRGLEPVWRLWVGVEGALPQHLLVVR